MSSGRLTHPRAHSSSAILPVYVAAPVSNPAHLSTLMTSAEQSVSPPPFCGSIDHRWSQQYPTLPSSHSHLICAAALLMLGIYLASLISSSISSSSASSNAGLDDA